MVEIIMDNFDAKTPGFFPRPSAKRDRCWGRLFIGVQKHYFHIPAFHTAHIRLFSRWHLSHSPGYKTWLLKKWRRMSSLLVVYDSVYFCDEKELHNKIFHNKFMNSCLRVEI